MIMDINSKLRALNAALPGKGRLKVSVWGDSLMLGVVLDDAAERYRIIRENAVSMCSNAVKATIENFSKFGCTVTKGKQRLLSHLDKGKPCDVVILEYGGNDCDMQWDAISAQPGLDHAPKVPLKQFSAMIQDMIDALVSHGTVPMLTNLPPLHPDRYLNWICRDGLSRENILSFLGDAHHIYRHQERYSLEVSRLARENECRLLDVRSAFLDHGDYGAFICKDGIHPNVKGQMLIRETLMAFMDKYMPGITLQPA